jgi:NodT family efflux transporter outer membrane factor (OMF) lipoprotein
MLSNMKTSVLIFVIATLTGCASVPVPMPEPLALHQAPSWRVDDYRSLSKGFFPSQSEDGMHHFIVEVLRNNPDLKAMTATIQAAAYGEDATAGARWPHAGLNMKGTRGKDALTEEIDNSVSVGLDTAWEVDLWGKLADETAAAGYQTKRAEAEFNQARLELITQAAHAWTTYRGHVYTKERLARLHTVYANLHAHYQEAYEEGLTPYAFYLDASNNLKRSQTRVQEIELELVKLLQSMNILRGRIPTAALSVADDRIVQQLVAFTEEVPASVLAERPDIQMAFMDLLALEHSARAAHKALLPQITLTGSALKSAESLSKVFSKELVWQLVGGLTQPLFNGGQLRAYARQKSAQAEASWWQFQQIVLQAMLEVEQALATERSLSQRLTQKEQALADLARKLGSAEEQLVAGDLPISDLLQIRAEHIEAQIELIETELSYIGNRLDLVMTLGLTMDIFPSTTPANRVEKHPYETS